MPKTSTTYHCVECGWTTIKWVGRCAECQSWGTVVEAGSQTNQSRVRAAVVGEADRARPITEASLTHSSHVPTGVEEFDRVLGGGIVPGAVILLSGEPGVGKSTLLLDVASRLATPEHSVLYVSAEESVGQVRLRAERTGALNESLLLTSTTDLATVLGQVEQSTPSLLIVDSVQTVSADTIDSLAGGPAQVKEVASALMRLAKSRDLPVIIVGHVTKDGQVAGPRTLEHLVDAVCHFEGDLQSSLRFVRALKSRFGPTDEVGCFEMVSEGIAEVSDPSALFRSAAPKKASGTCLTMALEGRRALTVEIQALVVPSSAPQPRRVVNGVDSARVAMVLAVLERRAGIALSQMDVYVSTLGGIRLGEPAADLSIAIAVASAARDRPVVHDLVAVGEISLAGEILPVASKDQRKNEASRLGLERFIDSSHLTVTDALSAALSPKDAGPRASSKNDRESSIEKPISQNNKGGF